MTNSEQPIQRAPQSPAHEGGAHAGQPPETPASAPASASAPVPAPASAAPIAIWLCVLLGAGAALVGLLPWLVTGMRLPLQNLWAFETMPEDMPIALLPFSQYAVTSIVGLLVTGAVVGGILARGLRRRMPRRGFAALVVTLLAVQAIAVGQSAVTVGDGLQHRAESTLYLSALVALAVLSMLVGLLLLWLVARAPRAGALIGLAFGAIAAGFWLGFLVHPIGSIVTYDSVWVSTALRFAPAVLIGAAIAWCGLDTVGRIVAAIASLIVLWIAPALATAVSSAVGMRVLASRLGEMLDYGLGVFALASTMPELVLPPLLVAVVVAAVGLAGRAVRTRRRPTDD
ncbi:hypothetical protein [Agromyces sp. Marseille-Q5079]|uniref:hypothetical protein n=1 Tax=Agromyces sp. Marseille-Q5079 TaxID=3439059 RepID=UPI003D9C81A8